MLHSGCTYRFHGNQSKGNSDGETGGSGCWAGGVEVSLKVYGKAGRLLPLWIKAHRTYGCPTLPVVF